MSISYDLKAFLFPFALIRMLIRRPHLGRELLSWRTTHWWTNLIFLAALGGLAALSRFLSWLEPMSSKAVVVIAVLVLCDVALHIGPYYRVRITEAGIDHRNTLMSWDNVRAWGWSEGRDQLWFRFGSEVAPLPRTWEVPAEWRAIVDGLVRQYAGEARDFVVPPPAARRRGFPYVERSAREATR